VQEEYGPITAAIHLQMLPPPREALYWPLGRQVTCAFRFFDAHGEELREPVTIEPVAVLAPATARPVEAVPEEPAPSPAAPEAAKAARARGSFRAARNTKEQQDGAAGSELESEGAPVSATTTEHAGVEGEAPMATPMTQAKAQGSAGEDSFRRNNNQPKSPESATVADGGGATEPSFIKRRLWATIPKSAVRMANLEQERTQSGRILQAQSDMAMAAQSLREMAMARWQLLLSRTPQALIFVVFRTWRAYIDGEKRRRARNRLDEELAKEGERLAEAMEFEAQRQTRQVAAAAAATMRAVEELIEDLILDLEDAAEAEAAARRPRAMSRITAYRIAAAKRGIASARSLSTKAPQLPFASVHPGNLSLRSMAQHLVDHGLTTPDLYMVHDKRELHDLARQHGLAHVLQAPPPPPLPLVRSPAIMQQQQQQQQQQPPPFGLQTPPMRHPKVPPLMPASPSSSAAIRSSWLAPQTTTAPSTSPVHVASARRHTTTSAPSAWTDDVSVTSFASGVGAQGGSSGSSSNAISGGSPFAIQTLRSSTPFLSGSRSAGKKSSPAAGQARAVTGSGGPRPLPALGMLPRAAASRANISQAAMKLHTIDLSERNATRSKLFLDERAQIKALEYAENFARVEAAARLLQQRLRARLSESITRRKMSVIMRIGKAHRATVIQKCWRNFMKRRFGPSYAAVVIERCRERKRTDEFVRELLGGIVALAVRRINSRNRLSGSSTKLWAAGGSSASPIAGIRGQGANHRRERAASTTKEVLPQAKAFGTPRAKAVVTPRAKAVGTPRGSKVGNGSSSARGGRAPSAAAPKKSTSSKSSK